MTTKLTYQLPRQWKELHEMLGRMQLSEGEYTATLSKGHIMSHDQRALWWVWMDQIAKYIEKTTGYKATKKQVSVKMKHDFLGYEPKLHPDVPAQLKSISANSKREKTEIYHAMCQIDAHWAERGLLLEKPENSEFWKYWTENG